MNEQYLRRAQLVVSNGERELDLSELRFRFKIQQSDFSTPNNATIRVWNLSDATARLVEKEFTSVAVQAGYQSDAQYGTIFAGEVKQTRRGRESGQITDTYLDIAAAEGDLALLNTFLMQTAEGELSTPNEQVQAIIAAMQKADPEIIPGYIMDMPTQVMSRPKVLYGMAIDNVRSIERTYGARFSVQGKKVNLVPVDGYIPVGAARPIFALNAATGLIGRPEVTQEGVKVRTLLNPNIAVGGLVLINNEAVEDLLLSGEVLRWPDRLETYPSLKPVVPEGDGYYKVLAIDYMGDTRGNTWHSELTCLALLGNPPTGKVANP